MAERKPLVIVDGIISELPLTDTLKGSGGASVKSLNFIGCLKNIAGVSRWVPHQNVTITGVYLIVTLPSPADTIITVKKNGISVGTITLAANTYSCPATAFSSPLTTSDYLTCDLAANGGENLTVNVIYQ